MSAEPDPTARDAVVAAFMDTMSEREPVETPADFCRWLLTLDDRDDVLGMAQRRTVNLTQIINRARAALGE